MRDSYINCPGFTYLIVGHGQDLEICGRGLYVYVQYAILAEALIEFDGEIIGRRFP